MNLENGVYLVATHQAGAWAYQGIALVSVGDSETSTAVYKIVGGTSFTNSLNMTITYDTKTLEISASATIRIVIYTLGKRY